MSAYRLYSQKRQDNVSVSLIHGYKNQEKLSLFEEQFFISELKSGNLFSGLRFLRKLKKWIRGNATKFDVVHCLGGYHASFMTAKLFEEEGVPAFIKITESVNTGFNKSSFVSNFLGLRRYRIKHANDITGYISISSEIKRKLTLVGIQPSKIVEIPNGVNTEYFKPLGAQEKKNLRRDLGYDDIFTVLFTGGFSSRKNPSLVVKAFEKYYNSENIQLVLVGPDRDNGAERRCVLNVIAQQNVTNVKLLKFTSDILPYYQIADLFVLPSTEEGLSNSMLEAQACGLPAIVTKISGAEDVINENENGRFVNLTETSIINAIDIYYNQPELLTSHSANARNKIIEEYSAAEVYKKHIDLFYSVKQAGKF
jgi:glycosyltransferase involved in cell wall biosynthesis